MYRIFREINVVMKSHQFYTENFWMLSTSSTTQNSHRLIPSSVKNRIKLTEERTFKTTTTVDMYCTSEKRKLKVSSILKPLLRATTKLRSRESTLVGNRYKDFVDSTKKGTSFITGPICSTGDNFSRTRLHKCTDLN